MNENTANKTEDKAIKEEKKIRLNSSNKNDLQIMAKWFAFISFVGFLITLLSLVVGIFLIISPKVLVRNTQNMLENQNLIFLISGIVYLILAILFYLPSHFLFYSSRNIRKGILYSNQDQLDKGLFYLKRVAIFMGVLLIIFLVNIIFAIVITATSYTMIQFLM